MTQKEKEGNIKIVCDYNSIIIYINQLPHLCIPIAGYRGFQSWKVGDNKYIIEHSYKGGDRITCSYDKKEKWENILRQLNNINKNNTLF